MTRARLLFACLLLTGCAASKPPADADETYGVLELRADAEDLRAMVNEPWILRFLAATEQLSPVPPRTLMVDAERKAAYTRKEAAELPAAEQAGLRKETFDDTYYFTTRFGTPLAYVRPFQVLAGAGLADVKGKKVLDFGHGMITQLQLLARIGADVVGVDVDPVARALYSFPGDQGPLGEGHLRLVTGAWPGDEATRAATGGGYDVILSKNVLKRGYIHPEQEVDPNKLVHLGVEDAAFLQAVQEALRPGGLFLIYNICPPPNAPGKPYVPWADGRSPFSKEALEAAGFEVLAFDVDDNGPMRRMGKLLDWPDVDRDFFAEYTLARKR